MVNDDGFLELVQSRRSIRRYQQRPIAQSVLEELLTAATWAPSAHNRQPWRFCVVTSAATKFALSERMGEQWRKDLTVDNADPDFIERRVAISHARITG
ncbi:MAG: nitroreductase family protein, partial [Caldilineaceae bacterium]|nr:nitroreductase family protein [Caldilineaceae bacterium]